MTCLLLPDDRQLEKKLSPEIFLCELQLAPLEVKLRLGAVVEKPAAFVAEERERRAVVPYADELMA